MSKKAYEWNYASVLDTADDKGYEVIQTADNRLLIDIDSTEDGKQFDASYKLLKEYFSLSMVQRYRSASGDGWHVVLACKPCNFTTRIALQACLGSDRKREALALMLKDDDQEVSFLLKPGRGAHA